jgi:type I site-specific restriction endonuclease
MPCNEQALLLNIYRASVSAYSASIVLAVVEAKKCSRNAREADEQLRHYVTEIAKRQTFAPFGFMANGHDVWFWEVGLAHPRLVAGFFPPADLERLKFLRQNRQTARSDPYQWLDCGPSLSARGHPPYRRGFRGKQAPSTSRHGHRHE